MSVERSQTEAGADPAETRELEASQAAPRALRLAEEERRRQELAEAYEAAAVEKERYADLFEHAPVAYVVADPLGRIREANGRAADLLETADLVGRSLVPWFEDGRDLRSRLRSLARAGGVEEWEAVLLPAGGQPRRVEIVARGGRSGDVRFAFRDIERRALAEAELKLLTRQLEQRVAERTEQLAAVIESLPAGVLIVEAPSRRITFANALAQAYLAGASFDADDWPVARALGGEVVLGEPVEVRPAEGRSMTVEVGASPVRGRSGGIFAAVLVIQDVSERERRERSQRDFVTNAAHELQTPLAAIASATEVLQSGAKDDPDARDRFLDHIERECARLVRLVRSLLTLARAQQLGEVPAREDVPLRRLLDRVALQVRPATGVEVRVRCPARLAVEANEELLEQAVADLAQNAAKYTTAGSIRLCAERTDSGVVVEVVDSGPGIPAGDEARVFDRFYRSEGRGRDGFGLGLAIVQAAVEALGASIELAPRRGGGTRATIRL